LWVAPPRFRWNYTHFAKPGATAPTPDETFEMTFVKDNAALDGFNKWTINGVSYPLTSMMAPASFHLKQGQRYRLHMRNASDDIHPIHLHRHSFELTSIAGIPTAGVMKDVVMLGGYQEIAVDFRRQQSRHDVISLPSAVAYGLRIHDTIRLCRLSESSLQPC
jgi:FtsP/CotA-like multicopper oxidase with cupredoxin domain